MPKIARYSDYTRFELQWNLAFKYLAYFKKVKTLITTTYRLFYRSSVNGRESPSLYRLSIKLLATIDELMEITEEINELSYAYSRMYSKKKPSTKNVISKKRKSVRKRRGRK